MGPRNAPLDGLRALSAVAVIHIHCLAPFFVKNAPAWQDPMRSVLDFATPSFFFLSGFFSPRDPRRGLAKRLLRIVVPYAVATFTHEALTFIAQSVRHGIWSEVVHELALTNLREHWHGDCLLHEKLPMYRDLFAFGPPASPGKAALEHFVLGTSFGFYYFVVVLIQLQLLAPLLAKIETPRAWHAVLAAAVAVSLLFRIGGLIWLVGKDDGGFAIKVTLRLPMTFVGFFVAGFYTRHFFLETAGRAAVQTRCRAAVALGGLALLAVFASRALDASEELKLTCREPFLYAMPTAVALYGAQKADGDAAQGRVSKRLCALRDDLSRCAYAMYLYHGFFNEDSLASLHVARLFHKGFWPRGLEVTLVTFLFVRGIADCLQADVSARYFGIAPAATQPDDKALSNL
ncbi:acyltransferase 3 [Pelagophyceae sp. CCMP2097]|nr:acyltransferase 3 [Pelagophyceae sp. CCMP2097]